MKYYTVVQMKPIKVKAVLFDFDGTIFDTYQFVNEAYKYTLKKNFNRAITDEEIRALLGKTLENTYKDLTGLGDVLHLMSDHQEFQLTHMYLGAPFKDTEGTLKQIKEKGIKIALVTSRHLKTLEKSLEDSGISDFDVIVHADNVSNHKPHPESLEKALKLLKIDPEDAVMVGDTDADILAGKSAGVKTIGATYGFYGKRIKEFNPDYLIDSLSELTALLES